jgi:predicted nucleotidyltransferase
MSPTAERLQRLLHAIPGLRLVMLFGSRASGTARPDSDLDVGILLDAPMPAAQVQQIVASIAGEFGCPVDVVDLFGAPEPLLGEVLKGERVCGDSSAHARLLTRHLIEAADFLPLRTRILEERRSAWIR